MMNGSMLLLQFWAPGLARPKGSMKAVSAVGTTHVWLTQQTDPQGLWAARVYQSAIDAARIAGLPLPIRDPLGISILYLFDRPAVSQFDVPATIKTGDIDKLTRNVFDALSPRKAPVKARVVVDDARFVNLETNADYADIGESCGAFVQLWTYRKAPRDALNSFRALRASQTHDHDPGVFG